MDGTLLGHIECREAAYLKLLLMNTVQGLVCATAGMMVFKYQVIVCATAGMMVLSIITSTAKVDRFILFVMITSFNSGTPITTAVISG